MRSPKVASTRASSAVVQSRHLAFHRLANFEFRCVSRRLEGLDFLSSISIDICVVPKFPRKSMRTRNLAHAAFLITLPLERQCTQL
jgi:hypothetical protein